MPSMRIYLSANTNAMLEKHINSAVTTSAKAHNVDPALIRAFMKQESANSWCAIRVENHLKRAKWYTRHLTEEEKKDDLAFCSMGLMQVLFGSAKAIGFNGSPLELMKIENSIYYGTKYISQLMKRYDDIDDAISSYNQGSPRKTKDGKYRNQEYVDRVKRYYRDIKKSLTK